MNEDARQSTLAAPAPSSPMEPQMLKAGWLKRDTERAAKQVARWKEPPMHPTPENAMREALTTFTFELRPMDIVPKIGVCGQQAVYVHEGSFAIVYGTNDKAIGWIDTHALFAGRVYRHHVVAPPSPPATADDERAREIVDSYVNTFGDGPSKLKQRIAAAFASIRATLTAEHEKAMTELRSKLDNAEEFVRGFQNKWEDERDAHASEVLALRETLEAVDSGVVLEGLLQEIVSTVLADTAPSAAAIIAEIKAAALPTEGQIIQATLRAFDTSATFNYQHEFAVYVGKTVFAAIMAAAPAASAVERIRAEEREVCAKIAENMPNSILQMWERPGGPPGNALRATNGKDIAAAIRARATDTTTGET